MATINYKINSKFIQDDQLSTGELLRDISSMAWALNPLLGKGKRYEDLLRYILDKTG